MNRTTCLAVVAVAAATALLDNPASATQETSQTYSLEPGWNAVFLEVEPTENDTESVFAGLPVDSVWTWNPRESPVQFIADPSEPRLRETGWLGYYPAPRPEAILTNLFRVQANRPYLIKLGGDQTVPWTVTGRPAYRAARWVPDAFNLVGGHVDPAAPPTFAQYFADSPAHDGQPIYRLEPSGIWQPIAAQTTMRSGEAFWIFTAGGSDWAGPMHIEPAVGDGVDFDAALTELTLSLTHRGSAPAAFVARLLTAGPISYQTFDAAANHLAWRELTSPAVVAADAGERTELRLAVRRADLTGDVFDSVLELTDGAGGRRLLPLRALQFGVTLVPGTGVPESGVPGTGGPVAVRSTSGSSFAGLWTGTVTLDQVSSVPDAPPDGAPPLADTVSSRFDLRLLVHVDDGGQARLLKEVIQMWQDGASPGEAGRFVLITDDSLIPLFEGAALADGEQVGRRVSSVAFDFDDASAGWDDTAKALRLEGGSFGIGGGTLDTTITLPRTHPSNPFYHRYHPQLGDDCGCSGEPTCIADCDAALTLVRLVELDFDDADPTLEPGDGPNPDWGVTRVAGTYRETITGLHRLPLQVAGTFSLRRIADQGALNP